MWHYEITGSGKRTILFLHGFGGFGGIWRWQTEFFKNKARVVTIDLPGHGATPWISSGLEDMAGGVLGIMDVENVGQADLVAGSFGGLIALKIWEMVPERVRSICFASSLPKFTAVDGFPAGLTPEAIAKLRGQLSQNTGGALDVFFRSLVTIQERESAQYRLVKDLRRNAPLPSLAALKAVLEALETADLRPTLREISCPVQFIFGDSDYICPRAVWEPLKSLRPGARVDIIPDAGHFSFLTRPVEFNRILRDFLQV